MMSECVRTGINDSMDWGINMKKLNILFTTAALALGLLLSTPSAMADPELKDNGSAAVYICIFFQEAGLFDLLGYKNFGQCVSFFKPDK